MTIRRKFIIGLSIVGVIALGSFREFLFIHINEQLFALWYNETSRASDYIPWLKRLDYQTLYVSKWFLTVLFSVLFYAATNGVLFLIFQRHFWKILGVLYAVLFLGAGVAMLIGYLSDTISQTYIIARFFMGIAQSPLPLMIMIPGAWLKAEP
ncbi:MAG: hypothetical protein WEC59_08715 [Salibacteraceae bacterium]